MLCEVFIKSLPIMSSPSCGEDTICW